MPANRVAQGVVVGLVAAGLLVASAMGVLVVYLSTCDGDGGGPYSAPDSTAGAFCNGAGINVWAVAALVIPALTGLVLGIRGIRSRAWLRVAAALGAGILLLLLLCAAVVMLPKGCSGSDQRAYDAWLAAGGRGNPPAECGRY